MSELLRVSGLKIEAQDETGWKEIVHGVDFTLNRGEVFGLIGESGAGKSTIGLATMGYCRPGCRISGGSILFDGIEMVSADEETKRKLRGTRIAYVAQSAAASFNPAENLISQHAEGPTHHGVMSHKEAAAQAVRLYRRLLLPDPEKIGYRYPHQVSGGQLQRAMVAMAMACKPDIIIFDEPTTALDVTTQIEVLAAIREVTRLSNTAAIYITHDLAVVAQMADMIMVLRYGNVVEVGPTRKLLAEPEQKYTAELLGVRKDNWPERSAEENDPPLLRVRDVTAAYTKGDPVVKNIDIDIHSGQTVAVVGESGSGKSTLARVITGLLPPEKGEIEFNGKKLPPALKMRDRDSLRHLQMIYQMPDVALNPKQRVRNILGRPLNFYFGLGNPRREKRIAELLEMVELSDKYINRLPGELSGGEKQRVCIARALAAEPKLIICDEITSALDQLVSQGILRLLRRLQEQTGISYLFITHDLATVKAIADRIVVMCQGEIVEQGGKAKVLRPPHHEYTELLLSSIPQMDPDWLSDLLERRQAGAA